MPPLHTGSVEIPKPFVAKAVEEYAFDDALYAADKILLPAPVALKSGTLPVVQREDMLRIERTLLSPAAHYGRVTFREKGLEFACEKNGLEGLLPDELRALYAVAFDAELVQTKQVRNLMLLAKEARVAAVLNGTTWTSGGATLYTDNSGTPWTTTTTVVLTQIEAAIERVRLNTGMLPNALICNTTNIGRLLQNTTISARFPGAPLVTREMLRQALASIFGLDTIIECGAVYNSAKEGKTFTGANVWSNLYAGVARVCKTPDLSEPGVGRTLRWTDVAGGGMSMEVSTYRSPSNDSDVIHVREYVDELVLGAAYMHLMKVAAS